MLIILLIFSFFETQMQKNNESINPETISQITPLNNTSLNTTQSPSILFSIPFGQEFDFPSGDPQIRLGYNIPGNQIAVDKKGVSCITGFINSNTLPEKNAYQPKFDGETDAFVAKFNASGFLVYSTYLGGNRSDQGTGIAIDSNGNCYVTGFTDSANFPIKNAFQSIYTKSTTGFISKFDNSGNLVFSTYLEGNTGEVWPSSVAVDKAGNSYITGYTNSNTFPTKNAYNATYSGYNEAFVTKFSSSGNLVYSTYLGGSNFDYGIGIAVDQTGACYVTGSTGSPDFPTKNAFNSTYSGSFSDVFLTKFSSTGSLVFSTYLGGNTRHPYYINNQFFNHDYSSGNGITVDSHGNIYIAGSTTSYVFPTKNAFNSTFGGGNFDGFVAKFNSTGGLVFSTYLGGNGTDQALYIAVDSNENTYVTGFTESKDFPVNHAIITQLNGNLDVFVTKFNSTGGLVYSTYLGGNNSDQVYGLGIDNYRNCFIFGYTYSSDFPANNAYNESFNTTGSIFLLKMSSYPAYKPPLENSGPLIDVQFFILFSFFMFVLSIIVVYVSVRYRKQIKKVIQKRRFYSRNYKKIFSRKNTHPKNQLSDTTLEKIDEILKEELQDKK